MQLLPFFMYRDVLYATGAWMHRSGDIQGCTGSFLLLQKRALPPSMAVVF